MGWIIEDSWMSSFDDILSYPLEHVFFKRPICDKKIFPTLSHSIHYGPKAVNVDIKSMCPRGPQEIAEYGAKDRFTVRLIVPKL